MFKIELCSEESFGEKVIATEYLDIETISDYKSKDFYPTFGPSNIDMYSEPGNLRIRSNTLNCSSSDLTDVAEIMPMNSDHEESNFRNRSYIPINGTTPGGGDYVARLLLHIDSNRAETSKRKNHHQDENPFEKITQNEKQFTLFAMISDVYLIDYRYQNDLSFQLCIGKLF